MANFNDHTVVHNKKKQKLKSSLQNCDIKSNKTGNFIDGYTSKKPTAFVKPLLNAETNIEDKTNQMKNILVADNNEIGADNSIDYVTATDNVDVQAMEDEMVLLEQKEIEEIDKEWEEKVNDEKDSFEKEVSFNPQEVGILQTSAVNSDPGQEVDAQTIRYFKEKKRKCNQCGQLFHRDSLQRHILVKHTTTNKPVKAKNNKCEECDKLFRHPNELKYHIQIQHRVKRILKCDQCNHKFVHEKNLKQHMRVHTRHAQQLIATGLNTPSKNSSRPMTEVLQLTVLVKVARQSCLPRSVARRPCLPVEEGRLQERVRALKPCQVQALLARRGARVDITMDWVVRLCMVERGEAGEQVERVLMCGCGKRFQGGRSFQTHQKWCRCAAVKLEENASDKGDVCDVEKSDKEKFKEAPRTVKTKPSDPFHGQNMPGTQHPIHGMKVKTQYTTEGVQVTTLHPSMPLALPSLPPASVSAL